jgi:hypothetical protein
VVEARSDEMPCVTSSELSLPVGTTTFQPPNARAARVRPIEREVRVEI